MSLARPSGHESVLARDYPGLVMHATDGILQSASPAPWAWRSVQDRPARVTRSVLSRIDANHQASVAAPARDCAGSATTGQKERARVQRRTGLNLRTREECL